ncbi:MAG: tyrosine-type recombinase/integrase [Lacunisphaera sp.]
MLRDYLAALRVRGLSPATLTSRKAAVRRFLGRLEKKDLRAVTRGDVQAHAASLLFRRLTAGTVGVHLTALRSFFDWLETTDAVLVNPCVGVPRPKLPDRLPRRVLTTGEVKKILAQPDTGTSQGKRDRALLEVFYSSGLRLAEAAALGLHDLDLSGGLVRVARGKGGRGRVAPLGASAVEALRVYLAVRRAWLEVRGQMEAALWLSPIKPHGPLKKEAVALVVRRCARRAGIAASAHAWRHTCATHLMRDGAAIVYVQRLLGHRSLATTQIYTRVSATDVRAMVRASHPRS